MPETQEPENVAAEAETSVILAGDPVREAFQAIEKVLKLRRLYDSAHRLRVEADEELIAKFDRALETEGILRLDVSPDEIEFDGRALLEGKRSDSSIPFRLFRDGVRTLTVRPGIEPEELHRFVNVLGFAADSSDHFDEDLVTLLWREDFEAIEYVALDETGVGEDNAGKIGTASRPDEMERRVEEIAAAILSARPTDVVEGNAGIRVTADREDLLHSERRSSAPEVATDTDLGFLHVPEASVAALKKENDADTEAALVDRVLLILFDLIREDEEKVEADGLAALLTQFVKSCLDRRDLALVSRILEKTEAGARGPLESLPATLGRELSRRASLEQIRIAISTGFTGGPEAVVALLRRLDPGALPFVADMASRLEDEEMAGVCRTEVLRRGADSPDALLALLDSTSPEASGGILASTLARCSREEATRLLTAMLGDARPGIRAAACHAIEEARSTDLLPELAGALETGQLDQEDRIRFLHAIAVLGEPASLDCLNTHLGPRRASSLRSRRSHEDRRAAILALADVNEPKVRSFLTSGTQSKDRRFAEACREALAMRAGGAG